MRKGTHIASRADGAVVIYDGMLDVAGVKEIAVAHIEVDGRSGPTQPVMSALVRGGWTILVDKASWEALLKNM